MSPVFQREYDTEDAPVRVKKINRNKRTDHVNGEEAPIEAFSHYLRLANGDTVRFNVGNMPNDPLPTSFGGVPVVEVHHAIAPGTTSEEDEDE